MLTVVGIIAVLVAVSIPVVNSSLKKAQVATDAANERAAKGAMLMESLLTENPGGASTMYYDNAAGQWKAEADKSSIAAYGKCEVHKDCYLKGTMKDSAVELEWVKKADGTPAGGLCSETLMAETGGGSTPPTPNVPAGIKQGDFYVQGSGYSFNEGVGVLTIENNADVTIRGDGKPTSNRIKVAQNASAVITLDNVNIVVAQDIYAFEITDNSAGTVTVKLNGDNILNGGLHKGSGNGWLIIEGPGTLTATTTNSNTSGIGGLNMECTNIEIKSGTVIASSTSGAGIGGAYGQSTSNIKISGGTVSANGGGTGAGIGGDAGSASNITITGGTVRASGGSGAGAGIGGGSGCSGSNITIYGGEVTATGGSSGGAGIGGGNGGKGENITIKGGKVTATGQGGGKAIGGGKNGTSSGLKVSGNDPYNPDTQETTTGEKREYTITLPPVTPP